MEFDPRYLRPAEVELLIGDPTKAKEKLGWEPAVSFPELVTLMVASDLAALGLSLPQGHQSPAWQDTAVIRQTTGSHYSD